MKALSILDALLAPFPAAAGCWKRPDSRER
jgi:hypothetical protein